MRVPLGPALLALLAAALIAGCGGDDGGSDEAAAPAPKTTARKASFPAANGGSAQDVIQGLQEGPVLAPAVSVLEPGTNRYAFALFDTARKQLSGAEVALYVAQTDGTNARGPYIAKTESLEVKPQFRSRQTAQDPDAARGVYVAQVPFKKAGKYAVFAVARLDGRLVATGAFGVEVGSKGALPPSVGDKAPVVSTPTAADVGGALEKIDTRIPPLRELHDVDFADIAGKQPAVLVFATPQLCQTKVCGPVVDVTAQVQSEIRDDDIAFIHMEIYNDNQVNKGFREQVRRYRLPTEPWAFVVGRDGRIVERFEGAFSVAELRSAIEKIR